MKKLILLPILFAFGCTPQPNCQCFNEVVFFNDGQPYLIEQTEADQNKCDKWGYGEEYLPLRNSEFHHRFVEICD